MQKSKTLISAIIGTSAMTLFSNLVSDYENKNYREPEVLGQLIERLPKDISKGKARLTGWGMHYAIGFLFVSIYNELWKRKIVNPSLISGATIGAASGLAGIVGWKGMFEVHPNPPAKNLKKYFGHLMLAHVVFGVFSALTYKLMPVDK